MTPRDVAAGVTWILTERAFHAFWQGGLLRRWMLTYLWSNGFLSFVCDVGLWFRFTKYGSTRQKQNLDKIIALRLAIYFSLTSADKRCWIDCTDTSLTDSEISDNRSLIIQNPTSIATRQWSQTLHTWDGPSVKYIFTAVNQIIDEMTFQIRRLDSSYKKPRKSKPWKEHVFREI